MNIERKGNAIEISDYEDEVEYWLLNPFTGMKICRISKEKAEDYRKQRQPVAEIIPVRILQQIASPGENVFIRLVKSEGKPCRKTNKKSV